MKLIQMTKNLLIQLKKKTMKVIVVYIKNYLILKRIIIHKYSFIYNFEIYINMLLIHFINIIEKKII